MKQKQLLRHQAENLCKLIYEVGNEIKDLYIF